MTLAPGCRQWLEKRRRRRAGNDFLLGGGGNNVLDRVSGSNTAIFFGPRSGYDVRS
jgi:hypothetical protein